MKKTLPLVAVLALSSAAVAACVREDAPKDSAVAEAMPDTSAPRAGDRAMTAPDAGATGTVPADGSQPPVAQTPPVGTAGGNNTPNAGAGAQGAATQ